MGALKDSIHQAEYLQAAQQLGDLKSRVRQIGGQMLSMAAAYRDVKMMSVDADDTAELESRFSFALASVKADIDAADPEVKAIITGALSSLLS